jgi:hypothetical protein
MTGRKAEHAKGSGDDGRRECRYVREEAQGSGGCGDRAGLVLTRIILEHRKHQGRRIHVLTRGV